LMFGHDRGTEHSVKAAAAAAGQGANVPGPELTRIQRSPGARLSRWKNLKS
jgi:hypothetical protein